MGWWSALRLLHRLNKALVVVAIIQFDVSKRIKRSNVLLVSMSDDDDRVDVRRLAGPTCQL